VKGDVSQREKEEKREKGHGSGCLSFPFPCSFSKVTSVQNPLKPPVTSSSPIQALQPQASKQEAKERKKPL
jgi:hypothetical protein